MQAVAWAQPYVSWQDTGSYTKRICDMIYVYIYLSIYLYIYIYIYISRSISTRYKEVLTVNTPKGHTHM